MPIKTKRKKPPVEQPRPGEVKVKPGQPGPYDPKPPKSPISPSRPRPKAP